MRTTNRILSALLGLVLLAVGLAVAIETALIAWGGRPAVVPVDRWYASLRGLRFADGPAQYGGTVTGTAGAGAMSSFDGSPGGCWYLARQGSAGGPGSADSSAGQPADVAGRRLDSAGTAPGAPDGPGTAPGELDAAGNRI